jgi:hypothetical protein
MSLTKKRLTVIGSGIAVAGLAIGGVAYAAFSQSANAATSGTAGAEKFAPLTASGTYLGRPAANGTYSPDAKLLLPGESGDVSLSLTNPGSNTVQGKVVSITPAALQDDCSGHIKVAKYSPGSTVVVKNGTVVTVTLKNAVSLDSTATSDCQGKTFTPTYTVQFEATRETVTPNPAPLNPDGGAANPGGGGDGAPNPPGGPAGK